MHKLQLTFMLISVPLAVLLAKPISLKSPNGKIEITINTEKQLTWAVRSEGSTVLEPSPLAMSFNNDVVAGKDMQAVKTKTRSVDQVLTPVIRVKNSRVLDKFNELEITPRGNYSVLFRCYDDGVAYRFVTRFSQPVQVMDEQVRFIFSDDHSTWFPEEESMFSHNERQYLRLKLSQIKAERFCSLPMVVALTNGTKVLISEADLEDYPGLWLEGGGSVPHSLHGKFSHFPLETKLSGDRNVRITRHADYLAETSAVRSYPWRFLIISRNDSQLIESEMVFKLAKPCELTDTAWIQPGKVQWDWWNSLNVYGVDFKSGVNTSTYKYFIDSAAKNGAQYIILDEGWYDLNDLMKVAPEVNMEELVSYSREKKIGLILWTTWKALEDKMEEAMTRFEGWGIKGIKVDFMQRDDQWMVNFYYRTARMAAKHKLMVDFHGAYKPTGLIRTLPNVVTSEGVKGLENLKWSRLPDPEHNLLLPFTRMVAGPMDYTPGAMINKDSASFYIDFNEPMSLGTRCHQLALYVAFESPLQMLSDSPSNYEREPVCMDFLRRVPTVWDETRVLKAAMGDYLVIARRSGTTWFLAALTDWTSRSFDIALDFLGDDDYLLESWQDGINVDRHAADFKYAQQSVSDQSRIKIEMAKGGGWVGIINRN